MHVLVCTGLRTAGPPLSAYVFIVQGFVEERVDKD
jgi:hypothetical protein